MAEIHPIFSTIAAESPEFAAACSEIFIGNRYTFIEDPEQVEGLPYGSGFPRVPSMFTAVTATYLEGDPDQQVRLKQQFLIDPKSPLDPSKVARLYDKTVADAQYQFDQLFTDGLFSLMPGDSTSNPNVQQFYAESAIRHNIKVLGAHVVFCTVEKMELVDALVYPKPVEEDLSLMIREVAVAARHIVADIEVPDDIDALLGKDVNLTQEELEALKEKGMEGLQALMRRDESTKAFGGLVAASFLPSSEKIQMATKIAKSQQQPFQQPSRPNRAQRRRKK